MVFIWIGLKVQGSPQMPMTHTSKPFCALSFRLEAGITWHLGGVGRIEEMVENQMEKNI